MNTEQAKIIRHDWQLSEVQALYDLPFTDLLLQAQMIHRQYFDPNTVQISTLLSIKTGGCPEDCAYCPQSARYKTHVEIERMMDEATVIRAALVAKQNGATRFCMGAAGRVPKNKEIKHVAQLIKAVKKLGMETCVTLGMLTDEQAAELYDAGLDYYNHNLDTSESFYSEVITTRTYDDRLQTLKRVRKSGIKVCCGGILGMGEQQEDRSNLLITLANHNPHPESVPINMLIRFKGIPLEKLPAFDNFEFVRTIAIARIMMPKSFVRLSAGREYMNEEMHALCFFAGANSIHYGEKLLTGKIPSTEHDQKLMKRLGITPLELNRAEYA